MLMYADMITESWYKDKGNIDSATKANGQSRFVVYTGKAKYGKVADSWYINMSTCINDLI